MRRVLTAAVFFAVLIAAWEALARAGIWSPVLAPSPLSVARYIVGAIRDETLIHAAFITLRRLLAGYVLGILFGVPLGLVTARFKFCEDTLGVIALDAGDFTEAGKQLDLVVADPEAPTAEKRSAESLLGLVAANRPAK